MNGVSRKEYWERLFLTKLPLPKNEIEEFKFDYHSSLKSYERYYTYKITLKNGSIIKNVYRELVASASKYKDNPVTDYLRNYFYGS